MKLQEIHELSESINDKGLFKAVFFAGSPGAGKTYVQQQISDGGMPVRVVNTDKFIEFIGHQKGIDLSKKENQYAILDKAKHLTKAQFTNYINGMLPLFIDGTSSNAPNTLRRVGILEGFGYDVAMVWVDTDLETSIKRASERERKVDEDFIRKVYESSAGNKKFFQGKFGKNFTVINNNDGELTDKVISDAFKKSVKFFKGPLENPIGQRHVKKLRDEKQKYLIPNAYEKSEIDKILDIWYKAAR